MQESQEPARTAAALCPWLSMSLEEAAAPAAVGEWLEALLETPALVGVAAKGGANAQGQAGFPPWSISFQLGDPTIEWCFLVPHAQTGAPHVDASLRKCLVCPQTNSTTHILAPTLDVFWLPVPHKPLLEGKK